MDEKIYHDFLKTATGLLAELAKVETPEGTVALEQVVNVMDTFFPFKSPEMIAVLRTKVRGEGEGEAIAC